jgi:hypothetical protein
LLLFRLTILEPRLGHFGLFRLIPGQWVLLVALGVRRVGIVALGVRRVGIFGVERKRKLGTC